MTYRSVYFVVNPLCVISLFGKFIRHLVDLYVYMYCKSVDVCILLTRDNFSNDICRHPCTTELEKFVTELFLKKILFLDHENEFNYLNDEARKKTHYFRLLN